MDNRRLTAHSGHSGSTFDRSESIVMCTFVFVFVCCKNYSYPYMAVDYYWNLLYYDDAISFNVVWLQCRVLKYEVVVEPSTSFNCCSTCFSLLRAIHSVSGLCQLLFLSRGFLSAYFVAVWGVEWERYQILSPKFRQICIFWLVELHKRPWTQGDE